VCWSRRSVLQGVQKGIHDLLSVGFAHSVMRSQNLLQPRVQALNLVRRVRYPKSGIILVGEQPSQMRLYGLSCRPQPPVRISSAACGERSPLGEELVPTDAPIVKPVCELRLAHIEQSPAQRQEFTPTLQSWSACQLSPDNLKHMELAYLHGNSVMDASNPVCPSQTTAFISVPRERMASSPSLYAALVSLLTYCPLKHRASVRVLEQHHPEATSKIGRVHDDDGQIWR